MCWFFNLGNQAPETAKRWRFLAVEIHGELYSLISGVGRTLYGGGCLAE
jgi:hypothetical protein